MNEVTDICMQGERKDEIKSEPYSSFFSTKLNLCTVWGMCRMQGAYRYKKSESD